MTSGKGANPESSEPVLDLETQLDDLLEQIEQAEPGLISTPAPDTTAKTQAKSQAKPSIENQTDDRPIESSADAVIEATIDDAEDDAGDNTDDDDDMFDLEGDFEAVEPIESFDNDQVTAETVAEIDDLLAAVNDADANDNVEENVDDAALVDQELAAKFENEDFADEDETDEEDDADEVAFSPNDFITTEQAADAPEDTPSPAGSAQVNQPAEIVADTATSDKIVNQDEDEDPLGLDLASQIQQLLDDARPIDASSEPAQTPAAKARPAPPAPPAIPKRAEAAEPDPVADEPKAADKNTDDTADDAADDQQVFQGSFEAPDNDFADSSDLADTLNAVAQAVAKPEPSKPRAAIDEPPAKDEARAIPSESAEKDDAAAMSLDDIDQMLADEADEAVAGDFETPNEVFTGAAGEAKAATSSPQAAAKPDADSITDSPDDYKEEDAASDEDFDFGGSFESTEEIITQEVGQPAGSGKAKGLSADAQAVARELDEQPENQAHRINAGTGSSAGSSDSRSLPRMAAFAKVPNVARHVCATISRPMEAVAPQTRDLVGYIGLITLFWGTVTVIVKLLFAGNS